MADNRYRVRRGASPSYYRNISAITEADIGRRAEILNTGAAMRSQEVQDRYNLLAAFTGNTLQAVGAGLDAKLRYTVERERLLLARDAYAATTAMEMLKADAESKKMQIALAAQDKKNQLLDLELANLKIASRAAPIAARAAQLLANAATNIIPEADYKKASDVFAGLNKQIADMLSEEEKNTPGVTGAVYADKSFQDISNQIRSNVISKMKGTEFVDSAGRKISLATIDSTFKEPARATTDALASAVSAVAFDPNAMQQRSIVDSMRSAEAELRLRVENGDQAAAAAVTLLDLRRRNPAAAAMAANGDWVGARNKATMDEAAMQEMMDSLGIVVGSPLGGAKPEATLSAKAAVDEVAAGRMTSARAALTVRPEEREAFRQEVSSVAATRIAGQAVAREREAWNTARQGIYAKIDARDPAVTAVGIGANQEKANYDELSNAMRLRVAQLVTGIPDTEKGPPGLMRATTAEAGKQKLKEIAEFLASPQSQEQQIFNRINVGAITPGTAASASLVGGVKQQMAEGGPWVKGGKSALSAVVGMLDNTNGGKDLVPQTLTSLDLNDPKQAAKLADFAASNMLSGDVRAMSKYQINTASGLPFENVAQLVLWAKLQDIVNGRDPLTTQQVLAWASDPSRDPQTGARLLVSSSWPTPPRGPYLIGVGAVAPAAAPGPGQAASLVPPPAKP